MARKLVTALLVLALTLVAYGPMGVQASDIAAMSAMSGSMADCPMNDNDRDSKMNCAMDGGCMVRCAPLPVFQFISSFALVAPFTGSQVFYFSLTDPPSAAASPPFRPPRLSILA